MLIMRSIAIIVFLLAAIVAVGSIGLRSQKALPRISGDDGGIHQSAEVNLMNLFWIIDIDVLGMAPQQCNTLFVDNFLPLLTTERNCYCCGAIRSENPILEIDPIIRLGEVNIIRNISIKIFYRGPSHEFFGSSTSDILEGNNKSVGNSLVSLVLINDLARRVLCYDSTQLFPGVGLGIDGGSPLLIDEKIAYDTRYYKENGRDTKNTRPSDQISMLFGIATLWLGCWLSWRSVSHFVHSDSQFGSVTYIGLLGSAIVMLWLGLAVLIPDSVWL